MNVKILKKGGIIIEIRVLTYFLAVAREENITKAAEMLHITQPTLSRQLAQLEEEMGVTLFKRGTRKITLTYEGLLLRRRAEEILELVDKTEKEVSHQNEVIEGSISIGCGDLYAVQVLAKILHSFTTLYPHVDFDLYTASSDLIKERIDRGLCDIGLFLEPVDLSRYDFIRISQKEKWVALVPANSPLAEKKFLTPSDFIGVPLIFPYRLNMQSELANWFGDIYDQLHILIKSNLSSNAAVMVQQGLACAVSIEGSLSFWNSDFVKCIDLSPPLMATTALAWKRNQPFSLAVEKFIEFSKDYLRSKTVV
ncbi:LysR family transcriptional regulator [Traorella massiliensis]|uniref:LysR family transcriptional regulator n=1 Tax=Traorella massiliensis TaxID=1903263 RepID=UPI0023526A8E|nr:LysR family transcriptional regulator [Traorella massiliensis]